MPSGMMAGMEASHWAKLGQAVRDRRTKLHMTQEDVAQAGGPSDFTMSKIEQGDPGPYRRSTLAALERALQWKPGAVEAILAGEDPGGWERPPSQERAPSSSSARDRVVTALLDYAGTLDNPTEVLAFARRLMEPSNQGVS